MAARRPITAVTASLDLNAAAYLHAAHQAAAPPQQGLRPAALLIHGLLGHPYQFAAISRALSLAGVRAESYRYKSRQDNLRGHAESLVSGQQWCDMVGRQERRSSGGSSINSPPPSPFSSVGKEAGLPSPAVPLFVTHSFGALVLREAFRISSWEGPAKVVMVAPPNRGSEFCRRLAPVPLARWVVGEAGSELMGLDAGELDARLGPLPRGVEGFVIAGSVGWNPLISATGSNDGTLAMVETRMPGIGADFADGGAFEFRTDKSSEGKADDAGASERHTVVRAPHNLLMYHPHTVEHIKRFFGMR